MTAGRWLTRVLCAVVLGLSASLSSELLRQLPYAHIDEILPGLMKTKQRAREEVMRTDYYVDYDELMEENDPETGSTSTVASSSTASATSTSTARTIAPVPAVEKTEIPQDFRSTNAECTEGVWSAWFYSAESKCSADCGACGKRRRGRTCLSLASGCPCIGLSEDRVPCNIGVCLYPQPSCCLPFQLLYVDGRFACGPQSDDIVGEFLNGIAESKIATGRLRAAANRIDFVQY